MKSIFLSPAYLRKRSPQSFVIFGLCLCILFKLYVVKLINHFLDGFWVYFVVWKGFLTPKRQNKSDSPTFSLSQFQLQGLSRLKTFESAGSPGSRCPGKMRLGAGPGGVSGNVPGSRRRSPFPEPRGRSVLASSSPLEWNGG